MRFSLLFIFYLCVSTAFAGPVAFTACLKSFGVYAAGSGSALVTCATTAVMPPVYLACVSTAIGVSGSIFFGACIMSLIAPTP